jgi:hypothetical protein
MYKFILSGLKIKIKKHSFNGNPENEDSKYLWQAALPIEIRGNERINVKLKRVLAIEKQ